jgi:hypothetical protein
MDGEKASIIKQQITNNRQDPMVNLLTIWPFEIGNYL